MTVAVEDPLISRMSISRTVPLHESSRRLRGLNPECPRMYGVAVMSDLSRRRWWPLTDLPTSDRLVSMFDAAATETDNCVAVTHQLAAELAHVVIGRVLPLLVLEGRAWDTGLENLWVHPDDRDRPSRSHPPSDRIVALPNEAALTTWVAHRSHRCLEPLFEKLADVSRARCPGRLWRAGPRLSRIATGKAC